MTAKLQQQNQQGAVLYFGGIIACANEQARLLRSGRLSELDLEHIAEEVEDLGKSEQRELATRMAVPIARLIKWSYQPERRGGSWQRKIRVQRRAIALRIKCTSSLKPMLRDADSQEEIWSDGVVFALAEIGVKDLPETCPWNMMQVFDPDWLPPLVS
jgi:hypothetical protein